MMDAPRARAVASQRAHSRALAVRAAWAALLACVVVNAPAQRRMLPASKPTPPPCVQVRIGQDEAGRWDCVNDAFKAEVDKVAPMTVSESPGERRVPIEQGLAVPAATRQRLGDQYGKSLTPQRPVRSFPAPPLARPPTN